MASDERRSLNRGQVTRALLDKTPRERVELFLAMSHHPEYKFYDGYVLRQIKLVDASEGRTEFEFTVTPEMCNSTGTFHGGCAATILDDLTSTPQFTMAKPGFLDGGAISRTLTCTYQRALKPGTKVKVICEVVGAGRQMAHFTGKIVTEDGKVAVSCVHDKFVVNASKL